MLRESKCEGKDLPQSQVVVAYEIVVVGTSWGGLIALKQLIGELPAAFALPVVVVQHRHRQSDNLLSTLLQDSTPLPVCEIEDKAPVAGGRRCVPVTVRATTSGPPFSPPGGRDRGAKR